MRLNDKLRLTSKKVGTFTKTIFTQMKSPNNCAYIKSYKFGDRAEQQISSISFSVDN